MAAVRAAESKKATDIRVLDLTGITSFTDYFVLCTGANQRQIQAISDEIGHGTQTAGRASPSAWKVTRMANGCSSDYGDFLVHIFSPTRPRVLRSGTPLAQRQERRDSRRVKIFLYFIGKPRDPDANAIAADFVERVDALRACEMREIRPDRFDLWSRHPSARKIFLDPAGREMDSRDFAALVAKAEMEGRDLVFLVGGADGLPAGWGARADLLLSLSAHDVSARTGARHARRADLSRV